MRDGNGRTCRNYDSYYFGRSNIVIYFIFWPCTVFRFSGFLVPNNLKTQNLELECRFADGGNLTRRSSAPKGSKIAPYSCDAKPPNESPPVVPAPFSHIGIQCALQLSRWSSLVPSLIFGVRILVQNCERDQNPWYNGIFCVWREVVFMKQRAEGLYWVHSKIWILPYFVFVEKKQIQDQ